MPIIFNSLRNAFPSTHSLLLLISLRTSAWRTRATQFPIARVIVSRPPRLSLASPVCCRRLQRRRRRRRRRPKLHKLALKHTHAAHRLRLWRRRASKLQIFPALSRRAREQETKRAFAPPPTRLTLTGKGCRRCCCCCWLLRRSWRPPFAHSLNWSHSRVARWWLPLLRATRLP